MRRNDQELSQSEISDQYERVRDKIRSLEQIDINLPFINKVIKDLQCYMQTITGEFKNAKFKDQLSPIKDRLSINRDILRDRLTLIEQLTECVTKAQEAKKEDELIQKYKEYITGDQIQKSRCFHSSNLKNIMDDTLSIKVGRSLDQIDESILSTEYGRVKTKVNELKTDGKIGIVIRAIDDVKLYLKTLEGTLTNTEGKTIHRSVKDNFDISIKIIIERLITIGKIIDLIKDTSISQSESQFLEEYKKLQDHITYGKYYYSNLKDIMNSSVILFQSQTRSPAVTPPKPTIPEEYMCKLTKKIMENPVLAEDGENYEKEAVENYIKDCKDKNQAGEAPSPVVPGKFIKTANPNKLLQKQIDAFKQKNAQVTSLGNR